MLLFHLQAFSPPSMPELAFTFKSGFSNWKIALFKDVGFKPQSKLGQHMNAIYAWSEYKRGIERPILDALNEGRKMRVEKNQRYIKTIPEVLVLTATQNTAHIKNLMTWTIRNIFGPFWIKLQSMAPLLREN